MTRDAIPEELFNEDIFDPIREKISYFKKSIDNYHCHIFSVALENVGDLDFYWELLGATVATNFQSKLKQDIELWNIYIIFFINDVISKEIKYKIEQDKYSSRKIVFDYLLYKRIVDDEYKLADIIENKLFSLNSKIVNDDKYDTSENIIKRLDTDLYNSLVDYSSSNKIEKFYNIYFQLKNGK